MPKYCPGLGPLYADMMVVGEFPSLSESEYGIPFLDAAGDILNNYLFKAGTHRDNCHLTYAVKYPAPGRDPKKFHTVNVDVDEQIGNLWNQEIAVIKPNVILAVGELALNAVTGLKGILNYRGSILTAKDGITKVVPTVNPNQLFSRGNAEVSAGGLDFTYTKLIQHDINRAVEESSSRILKLPHRELQVCHNSLDLFRFLRTYDKLELCSTDIESSNCIPISIGFAFNAHHAISIPLLRQIGPSKLTDMGDKEMDEIWEMVDQTLENKQLLGHNFKYDEFKLKLARFTVGRVRSDTLLKTRVLFPELPGKQLHVVSSLWTREPYYKEEGKEFKLGKSNISQLLLYNAKDCAVTFEVDAEQEKDLVELGELHGTDLKSYYYDYQMKKHKFYLEMENNGFKVDHDRKSELGHRYTKMEKLVHARIAEQVGHEVNVKSTPQMFDLLYKEMGFRPYKIAPTSEDSIVKLIGNHCKDKDGPAKIKILTDILEERRIRDQKSRYINFSPDYDDRCKTSFNIIATETGRSSTSVLKKPVRPKKIGLAFHTISKHGRLAKDIRSMFIPDKGKVFLQADSSQAEARVVAVLMQDYELLRAFDTIDIHRRTAGLVLGLCSSLDLFEGVHASDAIGKDSAERFCGKKTRHAGNYDMKKGRFMQEFNTDAQKFEIDMSISEWKAGVMLEQFHAASPKIKGVFHADIRDAINSTRTLIDPFGGIRIFNGRMDESLYQEAYANIPQRSVGHLVQGAALKIDEELGDLVGPIWSNSPANWLSENHDSLLMQVPENGWESYARLMQKYMTLTIDFSNCTLKRDYKLIIPCDIEIGEKNYAELHKVKL